MTDQELRQLVRDAITRHLGGPGVAAGPALAPIGATAHAEFYREHPSYGRFPVVPGPDGTCLIEPAVTCNQCGFCKSYGH